MPIHIPPEFWSYLGVGVLAQMVDGCLGMAYGVISTTVLLAAGLSPASASASVHAAKVFTGAASAAAHWGMGNVEKRLLILLSIGGVLGGVLGTYVLTSIDGKALKPYITGWLFLMGLVIIYRAWRGARPNPLPWLHPTGLGLFGGVFDAIGGGGWGPVVTGTLLGTGTDPKKAIGTTNAAEFFMAVAVSVSFVGALVTGHWKDAGILDVFWPLLGLIVGGVAAAPLAGWMTKVMPLRLLTWFVGFLIIGLSLWQWADTFKLFK